LGKRKQTSPTAEASDAGLVAILNNRGALAILREQGWYRIPVEHVPKRWPPTWLAFYQTKIFGDEAYAIQYWGRVKAINRVKRIDLFPNEIASARAAREYYRVQLHSLEQLPKPIPSRRWRRIVFISTTLSKLSVAAEINDLFDDSPLEDALWKALKAKGIDAERQWLAEFGDANYALDFAIFCNKGNIDVETDGDTWHAERSRIGLDNQRNNNVATEGWAVLRFNGHQIREGLNKYCIPTITRTIQELDGLKTDGFVPRKFHKLPHGTIQQLSLFGQAPSNENSEADDY
jgi:very-short-patch-repair endonuclease